MNEITLEKINKDALNVLTESLYDWGLDSTDEDYKAYTNFSYGVLALVEKINKKEKGSE